LTLACALAGGTNLAAGRAGAALLVSDIAAAGDENRLSRKARAESPRLVRFDGHAFVNERNRREVLPVAARRLTVRSQ
jgi:hypothetical protein